jgi:hypothetical protein
MELVLYAEPQMSYTAERYAPGEQKNPSFYRWTVRSLYDHQFLADQGFVPGKGMDRTKFKWTQEKYEQVLLHTCQIIYGPSQGKAFYDFVIEKNINDAMVEEILTDKYFGMLPGANIEIAYYRSYPGAVLKSFWTGKPEVRK